MITGITGMNGVAVHLGTESEETLPTVYKSFLTVFRSSLQSKLFGEEEQQAMANLMYIMEDLLPSEGQMIIASPQQRRENGAQPSERVH
jgi:hypothetical protein